MSFRAISSLEQEPGPKFGPWISSLLLVSFLLLSLSLAFASTSSSPPAFEAANRLYEEGRYRDAAAAYQSILGSNSNKLASAPLLFNLGNAEFKSGHLGRAIAAYRQAERLAPRDPDLRANLRFARNLVKGATVRPALPQQLLARLTLNEWTALASTALWLVFLLLAVRQWRPAWKRSLRSSLLLAALASLGLCACLAAAVAAANSAPNAIVLHTDTPVRQGPLEESPTGFTVHDGAELLILDQKDDWLRVSDGQKRTGWLLHTNVFVLNP